MRNKLDKYSKKNTFMIIISLFFCCILLLTYKSFIKENSKYEISGMYNTKLLYGITINNMNTNKIIVNNPGTTYYDIKISNLNDIKSKYKLSYNAQENISVKISSTSEWGLEGYLDKYGNELYEKTIRVAVVNNSDVSSTITFLCNGTYSYDNILSLDDSTFVSSIVDDEHISLSNNSDTLSDKIGDILDCTPTTNNPCLYTNEMINNYVSYSQKTWRIIGTYLIDGEVVTKLIYTDNYENKITYKKVQKSLDNFFKSLEESNNFLLPKVEMISKEEYRKVGGSNSYLKSNDNYWTSSKKEESAYEITKDGYKLTNISSVSGVKPTIFIKSDVITNGNGTKDNPYLLRLPLKDNIHIAMTIDGEEASSISESLLPLVLSSATCSNEETVTWDFRTNKLTITPYTEKEIECTLNFVTASSGYLAQVAIQGDYINYVGNNGCVGNACIGCNASPSTPGSECNNTTGRCGGGYYNSYGWRVAFIERNNTPTNYADDSVYITTGGSPECFYFSSTLTTYDEWGEEYDDLYYKSYKYCNNSYIYNGTCNSDSVWRISDAHFVKILENNSVYIDDCEGAYSSTCGQGNTIIANGGRYYLGKRYNGYYSYGVYIWNGSTVAGLTGDSAGIRPLLRLATGIQHDGTGNGTQANTFKLVP